MFRGERGPLVCITFLHGAKGEGGGECGGTIGELDVVSRAGGCDAWFPSVSAAEEGAGAHPLRVHPVAKQGERHGAQREQADHAEERERGTHSEGLVSRAVAGQSTTRRGGGGGDVRSRRVHFFAH